MIPSAFPSGVPSDVTVLPIATGPLQENAVFVHGPDGRGFLVDPGDEAGKLLAVVRERELAVEAILLTHAHFDHVGAVQDLREALGAPVWLHPAALEQHRAAAESAARFGLRLRQPADPDRELAQDAVLTAGAVTLRVRELFGHAPGHVVFLGEGFAVAGDTLFRASIGRTDLPGGDHAALIAGIERELLTLPDDTVVYPGHGPFTTVGREKRGNPFL